MAKTSVVIIGYGKIANDQHLPAIVANPGLELAAVVSERGAGPAGVPVFRSADELFASGLNFDACSHCNTPGARFETALRTIREGRHTMLEKPPAATLAQLATLQSEAQAQGVTLMTTWHSQANDAVERGRAWLADKTIRNVRIDWREDVRKWHPGQQWIWEPGGFGIFDPGINGLSVATRVLPFAPFVTRSELIFPSNRKMPIAANIDFGGAGFEGRMSAGFDWRETEGEVWQITVECREGLLTLDQGGRSLAIDGELVIEHGNDEYPHLYRQFAALVASGESYVHSDPLRIVADSFMLAERRETEAFFDETGQAA